MLFKDITILDETLTSREHQYVGTKEDKIAYIGDRMPKEDYGRAYEGKNRLLMTGFVNTHGHSPMTLLRGYGENMALQSWLNDRIFPFEDKLSSSAVYWGTLLGLAESIRFGIISTTDMYYFCEDMAKATLNSGVKNNISRSIMSFTDENLADTQRFQEAKAFYEAYHNAGNGRIKVDMSLHGEYTSNEKTARQLAEYTKKIGANMHVHISETALEHEECKQRHGGLTPVQYLNSVGLFDTKTTAAHCVHIEEEDFDILAKKGVTVASCPISNLKLASGVCNVPLLLKKGVNVTIGTDSAASNNSLNFLEEMKVFALANKGFFKDPTLVSPKETLYAATAAGALSQGRENCGKLALGYQADLIVLDMAVPNMHPIHRVENNIVYAACGSDVLLTMADGKVLYENGEYRTLDIEKTIFEAEKATQKILGQL